MPSLESLVEYAHGVPPPDFSRLTGLVLRCAEQGDATALAVLRAQGEELAYLVRLILRRLKTAAHDPAWTPPIAYAGSILENIPPFRDALMAAVRAEFPTAIAPAGVSGSNPRSTVAREDRQVCLHKTETSPIRNWISNQLTVYSALVTYLKRGQAWDPTVYPQGLYSYVWQP